MPLLLDGKKARDFHKAKLAERVTAFERKRHIKPCLAIIQIGDNPESSIYIEQKKKFAAAIGVSVEHVRFSEDASQDGVLEEIVALNADKKIHGIIVQLPVPAHINKLALINAIDPKKDVDGLTDENQKLLEQGNPRFIPATAKGVMMLLDFYNISVRGKNAAVFGRSRLVGGPIASLFQSRGARVSVIHSQTAEPQRISREADIVAVAIGKPSYVTKDFIKKSAIVVDVGINSVAGAKSEEGIPKRSLAGDVDFAAVSDIVSVISPVPGGVGPMTVLALFDNLMVSAEKPE
ncbi:MAG TPA: bifunctional 5,10-methylenetetrahydrofolate dehydrogenase/5,10-methenyltetrahydrofolate cyclohydrolase [Candidatus Paceibacterota bacterium]|nr:bifunctional 5,10-methylenetetrahydrofolate dehydrogenase/5,10-methenyltetrahydrofolate cyclohydrolase [Candidatus Paceibacterota bacterium]